MKFWNKQKRYRISHWTKVTVEYNDFNDVYAGAYTTTYARLKVDLQKLKSTGKFFIDANHYYSGDDPTDILGRRLSTISFFEVWAEQPADATYVTLRFSQY